VRHYRNAALGVGTPCLDTDRLIVITGALDPIA
jgi:hypothetical protein